MRVVTLSILCTVLEKASSSSIVQDVSEHHRDSLPMGLWGHPSILSHNILSIGLSAADSLTDLGSCSEVREKSTDHITFEFLESVCSLTGRVWDTRRPTLVSVPCNLDLDNIGFVLPFFILHNTVQRTAVHGVHAIRADVTVFTRDQRATRAQIVIVSIIVHVEIDRVECAITSLT